MDATQPIRIAAARIRRALVAWAAVAVAVAAASPAPAVAADPPLFTVAAQSRYLDGKALDADSAAFAAAVSTVDRTVFQVEVLDRAACGRRARWRVDGKLLPRPAGGCSFPVPLPARGAHTIAVRARADRPAQQVTVEDRLVVALGDSVASGEGNPVQAEGSAPSGGSAWASPRCHRSPVAGVEQAARVLGQGMVAARPVADAHGARLRSVTFVSLACSGATIDRGLLGPYRGISHRDGSPIPPQVDRLRALVRRRGARADAVLVSVGANDVHFGDIVVHCMKRSACPGKRVDPREFGAEGTADEVVGRALAGLGGRYDELARRLRGSVGAPGRVFLTEYFDPTRNARGETCPAIAGGSVSRAELEWAETSVLGPLNDEVAAAAQRNRWRLVDGIAAAFATHGYCTPRADRWIRRVEESLQNLSGPLHPNELGHRAIAAAIVPPAGQVLGIVARATDPPANGHRTPWTWIARGIALALAALAVALAAFAIAGRPRGGRFRFRFVNLLRRGHAPAAPASYRPPRIPRAVRGSGTSALVDIVVKGAGTLATAVVSTGFVVLVGAAIVWVRFWAARYPADQAVDAASREELLVIGASALALFAVLGAAAVLVMWLLDPRGSHGRRMIVAIAVLVLAELVAAVIVGGFGRRQVLALAVGFAAAAGLLVFLYERLRRLATGLRRMKRARPWEATKYIVGRYFPAAGETRPNWVLELVAGLVAIAAAVAIALVATDVEHARHRWLWAALPVAAVVLLLTRVLTRFMLELLPLLALAAALVGALRLDHADNRIALVIGPIGLAFLLFALPRPDPPPGPPPTPYEQALIEARMERRYAARARLRAALDPRRVRVPVALALVAGLAAALAAGGWWLVGWAAAALAVTCAYTAAYAALDEQRHEEDQPRHPYMNAARMAMATTLFACLAIFLAHDEWWLAAAAFAAVALAGVNLAIAWASKERFLPFGVTVFVSVCVFGAVLACLRTIDSPQAQPVAILVKDGGRAVCGVWVGESGGRVWYARLRLSELASTRRPAPRDSGLTSVRRDDVEDMALGPLQPVGRAQEQAVALRTALLSENGRAPMAEPTCGPLVPPHQKVAHTPERTLAKSVQPELVVDRKDGFWPVSVLTLLRMQDRRARVCRRVADGVCVRMLRQSDFAFNGGEGEWLDYPANPLHRDEEQDLFHDALGSVDPARTAREYFLVSHGAGPRAPVTVQFWFFYTYNYLQTVHALKHDAGLHEGDFETVAFLLSARTHRPRYVWMARHAGEGRMFVWEEEQLKKAGGRLVAYAARGSHATYESCRRQSRAIQAPLGLIDDRPQCRPEQELHLAPEATHIIDLSRVPWACWRGRFGERPGGRFLDHVPYESDEGPLGPLWQQTFGGVTSEPCRGVRDSDSREVDRRHGAGEEVLRDAISTRLRAGAGTLDRAVDRCADWEHPPSAGAFLLACDQRRLTRYLESGMERPPVEGLRIDVAGAAARPGPVTVPAVRRDPREPTLANWRVTTARATTAEVYAACQAGDGFLEARFPRVDVTPGHPLRIDGSDRATWRLRDPYGRSVAESAPHAIKKPRGDRPLACGT